MSGSNGRGSRSSKRSASASKANGRSSRPSAAPFVHFTLPTDYCRCREIQEWIVQEASRLGFNCHSLFGLRLALEEALINAIKHGNGMDAAKSVRIDARVTPEAAEVIIEDEGPGFDRRSIPDPTADENIEKPGGRGILLIEKYMNQARWTKGGRRLHMIKKNECNC